MSDDESILWKKLENSRQVPLEPLWLENVYSPNLTFDLRKALSEKMGLLADRGWPVIKCLLQRYGDLPDLVVAAGLCHQIEAREWLLELLTRSDDDENIQLLTVQSLSCWGAEVPAAIITKCLHHPSQAQRIAGLELIKFRSHLLTDEQLLDYCNEALNDFRDSVVIAAIRIIQRRDSKSISKKLYELCQKGSDSVADASLRALSCIATADSRYYLKLLSQSLTLDSRRELALQKLKEQYR
tara:strand:+ start:473 stop:1195 length:723 start_codon:yes stop_codon:yes gene_type:complete